MAKVLVIEDNPVNMKLAMLLLHQADHTVLSAIDAETGLRIARAERPDLVLMDLQLPGMDGLAATTLLKQDPATAAIPVIALTAMEMSVTQEEIHATDFDAYLAKPLRYQELYAAVDTLLTKSKAQGAREMDSIHQADLKESLPPSPPGAASSAQSHGATISPAAAIRPVDVGVLERLIGSDPAVILEFLNAFRTSAAEIALGLKIACDDRQPVQAARQAHKLRSSAHIVGAVALGGLCAEMEAAGKAGRTETLTALLPRFEQELDAVNSFLDTLQARPAN